MDFPLPQQPRFGQTSLVTLAQFEQGHRYQTALSISLDLIVPCETIAKNWQEVSDHFAVLALQDLVEHVRGGETLLRALNAIDQIMRILPLKTVIEREGLQAGEAHQVGVPHHFDGDSPTANEL